VQRILIIVLLLGAVGLWHAPRSLSAPAAVPGGGAAFVAAAVASGHEDGHREKACLPSADCSGHCSAPSFALPSHSIGPGLCRFATAEPQRTERNMRSAIVKRDPPIPRPLI
jgi:hypothetical protein